jgi:SAM-dependent methyltransferase
VQQRILPQSAIDAFDTPEGMAEQLQHFKSLLGFNPRSVFSLLDVGGGTGFFASAIQTKFPYAEITILDLNEQSVMKGKQLGLNAIHGSILDPPAEVRGRKFDVVSFNLIFHHIIGGDESSTFDLQSRALTQVRGLLANQGQMFVHEICYEGRLFPDLSARLIYEITASRCLSKVLRLVGRAIPALRANTAGIGVRFRPTRGWMALANRSGLEVVNACQGEPEGHSWLRRILLLIREVRRQSLLLRPAKGKEL